MSKKISSIIVVFFTILYVVVTLNLSGYNVLKMGSIKARQVINMTRNLSMRIALGLNKSPKAEYEEVKQDSAIVVQNNNQTNSKFEDKIYKLNILNVSKAVKKDKLENLYLAERELLKSIRDKAPIEENYTTNKKSEDTSVFSTGVEFKLTEEEKERILTASKKLSPLDQEKINTYLKYISANNAKNAINLLRDRLSDKDFEKLKDISAKLNKKQGKN
jgi:hypothetical protein